jgi:hypothetical protein
MVNSKKGKRGHNLMPADHSDIRVDIISHISLPYSQDSSAKSLAEERENRRESELGVTSRAELQHRKPNGEADLAPS